MFIECLDWQLVRSPISARQKKNTTFDIILGFPGYFSDI